MKKLILHIIFLTAPCLLTGLLPTSAVAQDVHFSQFFEAPLIRNPSLAGIFEGDLRIQGVYRDQWNSFTNAYKTGSLNAEFKQPIGRQNDFITIGLQLLTDKSGSAGLTTTHILPALNYHKSLNNDRNMYLSVGFMGGLVQKRIDRSKITTNNQYDGTAFNPALPDGEPFLDFKQTYWDGSAGMSFNTSVGNNINNTFFAGVAYHHFNRPLNSFYSNPAIGLAPKWVVSSGVKLEVNEYSFFNLQADFSTQGPREEVIGGALFGRKLGDLPEKPLYIIYAGAFLRWRDALIPVIKIDYRPLSVAISYDVNVSSLKTASMGRGGFELSVSFVGFLDRVNTTRDAVLCPKF